MPERALYDRPGRRPAQPVTGAESGAAAAAIAADAADAPAAPRDGGGIAAAIIRVRIPLPYPLRWVNSYIIPDAAAAGPDICSDAGSALASRSGPAHAPRPGSALASRSGWTLIDPGMNTPEARQIWERVLADLGLSPRDIVQIVLTHHHPDHYGLAGWFQERSGDAPVRLSPEGRRQAERLWGAGAPLTGETLRLFERHGLSREKLAEMRAHMDSFLPQVAPQPAVTELRAGEVVRMGGRDWQAIHTPGHAFGHLCFYQPEEQLMIAGDHVLPRISPNVGFVPAADADPLGSYLAALERIGAYPARLVFPGHRDPFADLAGRAAELIRHHEERLEKMAQALAVPMTAYALSEAYFGRELAVHTLRFALSETIAHLIRLEALGRVVREEREGVLWYQTA